MVSIRDHSSKIRKMLVMHTMLWRRFSGGLSDTKANNLPIMQMGWFGSCVLGILERRTAP